MRGSQLGFPLSSKINSGRCFSARPASIRRAYVVSDCQVQALIMSSNKDEVLWEREVKQGLGTDFAIVTPYAVRKCEARRASRP